MAIWQLSFQLIPINTSCDNAHTVLSNDSISMLSADFPVKASWCQEEKLFGSLDSTCVEIFYCDSMIDDISVRLDVSSLSIGQLNAIINFAVTNNLQIKHKNRILAASIENIYCMIRDSDALRYIKDPVRFLKTLSESC